MRDDEKQALISRAEQLIKHAEDARDDLPFCLSDDVDGELALIKIALASLTAEPVYQERRYQFIGKKQLEYWADIDRSGYGYLPESERRLIYTTPPALREPAEPVSRGYTLPDGWIKCSDMMPKPGVIVLVYTHPQPCDYPEDVRIGFDWIDPEGDDPTFWYQHGEHYEHYCCVAKTESSFGPSEIAPYTHWMPLPAPP